MARIARSRAARPARQCRRGPRVTSMVEAFEGAEPTPLSPWGLRLPPDSRVDDHPAFADGLVEVQDEGSQLIALACEPSRAADRRPVRRRRRQVAGARRGGARTAEIIACDTSRAAPVASCPTAPAAPERQSRRACSTRGARPRCSPTLQGQADVVLVDAPCAGSGTWRRNPEGRWRLTPDRLDRVVALQAASARSRRAAGQARRDAGLCDLLAPDARRGGAGGGFLGRHSGWSVQDSASTVDAGMELGRLLTPAHDRTDGFFIARLVGAMLGRDAFWLEKMMRFVPSCWCLASRVDAGDPCCRAAPRRPDHAAQSLEFLKQGEAALAAGNFIAADDALETALVGRPAQPRARSSRWPKRRDEAETVRPGDPPDQQGAGARARPIATRWRCRARRWSRSAPCRAPATISPSCRKSAPARARRRRALSRGDRARGPSSGRPLSRSPDRPTAQELN